MVVTEILPTGTENRTTAIFVDSNATRKTIEGNSIIAIVLQNKEALNNPGENNCVKIYWVPGLEDLVQNQSIGFYQ